MIPILEGRADPVLGRRPHIACPSEWFLNWLANLQVKVGDSGTGFRALKRDLAVCLKLSGKCICGIFVLELAAMGARIVEVPIELTKVEKPRKIAWFLIPQIMVCVVLVTQKIRRFFVTRGVGFTVSNLGRMFLGCTNW